MFEFAKVWKEYEALSPAERGAVLGVKSVEILAKLRQLDLPGVDSVQTLAGFILGSVVSDGRVNVADESLCEDIVMLCLCVVSIDHKISPREQRYIRKLCKA